MSSEQGVQYNVDYIEGEIKTILDDISYQEFSTEDWATMPHEFDPTELSRRKDFRHLCVFTVDNSWTRDQDDALSCEDLGNECYEVGVHISDVSYFVQPDTELDKVAAERSVSIYLEHKVLPMLPKVYSEDACVFIPGKDRPAISLFWTVNSDGEISNEQIEQSVIKSCVKLTFEEAQAFTNDPNFTLSTPVLNGFSNDGIRKRIVVLKKLANKLRNNRLKSGGLRWDQGTLKFHLDEKGLPVDYRLHMIDSDRIVGEFGLLASKSVACKIIHEFPRTAILNRQLEPQKSRFEGLNNFCNPLDIIMDTSSSKSIQRSIDEYGRFVNDEVKLRILVNQCLSTMERPEYVCIDKIPETEYGHYSLNLPCYTHFTSPVRRYIDVLVQRMIVDSLRGDKKLSAMTPEAVRKQVDHHNERSAIAKRVESLNRNLLFFVYLKNHGPVREDAVVKFVYKNLFNVLLLKSGFEAKIKCEKSQYRFFFNEDASKRRKLKLVWPANRDHPSEDTQIIEVFTHVVCVLEADGEPNGWNAVLLRPSEVPAS